MEFNKTYILTLKIDDESQEFFNQQRKLHFPPAINYLDAHLTLFHKLPLADYITESLSNLRQKPFELEVVKPINIGNGVAYSLKSTPLNDLHKHLSDVFNADLIPQDKQGYRPHITIQNKVAAVHASALLAKIQAEFNPFMVSAKGLDLWYYLGGPWEHVSTFVFND